MRAIPFEPHAGNQVMENVGPSDATDSSGDNDGMLAPLKRDKSQRGRPLQNVDPGGHYRLLESEEPQKCQIS